MKLLKKIEALDYDTKEGIDYNLKVLEVLGLIKFEEEKITLSPSMIIRSELWEVSNPMIKADHIVNALMKAGYIITKNNIELARRLRDGEANHV